MRDSNTKDYIFVLYDMKTMNHIKLMMDGLNKGSLMDCGVASEIDGVILKSSIV